MLTLPRRPAPLSTFVGRERELREAAELLARTRLLTITGTGGCGKTRLALRLADVVAERFPDGATVADLSRIGDPELVAPTLAAAMGVGAHSNLADAVGEASVLLVVDNCEHLIDAAASVIHDLLASCHGLRAVATSREPLGLEGEVVWRLPSLSLPPRSAMFDIARLQESDAVQLFCQRAFEHAPNFSLESANAVLVVDVVTRLDGIPLALELAASRVESMSLEEISRRLNDTFRLLTGGSRNSLARQQTLRAAVDWSFGLLGPGERVLFSRLAVFAGTFDLVAVESVAAGAPMPVAHVADVLGRLVAKSLVQTEPGRHGGLRYRLLEMLRQYSQELFRQLPAETQRRLRRRHAEHYVGLAEAAASASFGRDHWGRVSQLAEEYDNLGSALDWSSDDAGGGATYLRLVDALRPFWESRALLPEEVRRLRFAIQHTDIPESRRPALVRALGMALRRSGRPAEAIELLKEALAMTRAAADVKGIAWSLRALGVAQSAAGDDAAAGATFSEGLALSRAHGLRGQMATFLNNLALVALRGGRLEEAGSLIDEAMNSIDEAERWRLTSYLDSVARIRAAVGDAEGARAIYADILARSVGQGEPEEAANALEGLARFAIAEGRAARALSLLAAAARLRSESGMVSFTRDEDEIRQSEQAARTALAPTAAADAWARGQSTRFEDLLTLAQEPAVAVRTAGGLSHRERECARLVAAGFSNKEIAARLGISARTVETHLENLRIKLGLRGRAQVAAWAVDIGLRAPTP